jgi:hypothetical protein
MVFVVGTWVRLRSEQVSAMQIKDDGTSTLFPDLHFLVILQYVNADRSFITDQPHKYPCERFTQEFKVLALESRADDPQNVD